jgi:hypothetical protein
MLNVMAHFYGYILICFSRAQLINDLLKRASYISFALDPTFCKQIFAHFANLKSLLMFLLIAFTI